MLRIAGLASVAMAGVLPRAPDTGVDLPLWESMRYAHAAMFCSFGDEDLATSDGAMKVWQGNGIGTVLDKFISDKGKKSPAGQDRWLIKLGESFTDGQSTDLPGCSVTEDTTCDRPDGSKNCTAIFDDADATTLDKASFWIFKAVVGVQSKLSKLRSRLKEETLFLDLELKSLIKELGGDKPESKAQASWIAAALGIGETLIGKASGMGTITSIGFTLFNGLIDMTGDQTADEGDLQASLAKVSRSMGSNIDDMLSVAMGGGKGDDYDKLPIQSKGSYKNKVAQFFNTGFWLQNNDAGLVKEMMDAAVSNLRAKMVDEILSANGWYVSWYVWRNSEDKCPKEQGFEWVKAGSKYYCVILMNSSWSGPDFAEDKIYKTMDKNGLKDRKAYYGSLVDCAKNGDGKFDAKSLTYGKIPKCFFHLKVIDFV